MFSSRNRVNMRTEDLKDSGDLRQPPRCVNDYSVKSKLEGQEVKISRFRHLERAPEAKFETIRNTKGQALFVATFRTLGLVYSSTWGSGFGPTNGGNYEVFVCLFTFNFCGSDCTRANPIRNGFGLSVWYLILMDKIKIKRWIEWPDIGQYQQVEGLYRVSLFLFRSALLVLTGLFIISCTLGKDMSTLELD